MAACCAQLDLTCIPDRATKSCTVVVPVQASRGCAPLDRVQTVRRAVLMTLGGGDVLVWMYKNVTANFSGNICPNLQCVVEVCPHQNDLFRIIKIQSLLFLILVLLQIFSKIVVFSLMSNQISRKINSESGIYIENA